MSVVQYVAMATGTGTGRRYYMHTYNVFTYMHTTCI